MAPQFDIFRMKNGEYAWLEVTMTPDDAEARVQELGAAEPGEYLIFNQKTCGRISLRVEHRAKSGKPDKTDRMPRKVGVDSRL